MTKETEFDPSSLATILILAGGLAVSSCVVTVSVAAVSDPDGGGDGGSDAGMDAGPLDAGPPDSGAVDSGVPDSGPVDAGLDAGSDAGPQDAGPPDSGTDGGLACVIGGTSYPSRATNPADARQCCNPAVSPGAWVDWLIDAGTYLVASGPLGLVAEDLDGDGLLDLAVACSGGVSILLQSDGGAFVRQLPDIPVGSADSVAVRWRGTIPDLVVTAGGGGQVFDLFTNLGQGKFGSSATQFVSGDSPIVCETGSWTDGGSPDVFCINFRADGGEGAVLPGLPDGGLGAPVGFNLIEGPWSMTTGDFQGTGGKDIAVSHIGDDNLSILLDMGGGLFNVLPLLQVGDGPYGMAAEDVDRDGHVDLLVVQTNDGKLGFLKGKGDGTFAPLTTYLIGGSQPEWVVTADLNGDQWPDPVVASTGDQAVRILWNLGADGGFSPAVAFQVGTTPQRLIAADFNNDGAPDVAVANGDDDTVVFLMNGCP